MKQRSCSSDDIYGTIGNPKVTYDFSMSTDFGELEIYYANMAKMPEMDAATFAAQLGNAEKGKTGQVGAVETVTVGGQNYSKVSITRTNKKGKQNQTSLTWQKAGELYGDLSHQLHYVGCRRYGRCCKYDHSSPVTGRIIRTLREIPGAFLRHGEGVLHRQRLRRQASFLCLQNFPYGIVFPWKMVYNKQACKNTETYNLEELC